MSPMTYLAFRLDLANLLSQFFFLPARYSASGVSFCSLYFTFCMYLLPSLPFWHFKNIMYFPVSGFIIFGFAPLNEILISFCFACSKSK